LWEKGELARAKRIFLEAIEPKEISSPGSETEECRNLKSCEGSIPTGVVV
jgi:hypothetical protein